MYHQMMKWCKVDWCCEQQFVFMSRMHFFVQSYTIANNQMSCVDVDCVSLVTVLLSISRLPCEIRRGTAIGGDWSDHGAATSICCAVSVLADCC